MRVRRPVLLAVLLPSLALRVAVLLQNPPVVEVDTTSYVRLATALASRNMQGDWGQRTPAYPLLLAVLGSSPLAVAAFQTIVLGCATAGLAAFATWMMTGRQDASIVAGLLYGLNLMQVAYEMTLLPEALCAFLLVAVFACIAWLSTRVIVTPSSQFWAVALLGLTAGLLCLARPQYLYVPVVAVAYCLWRFRSRLALVLLVVALSLGPVMGWSSYNYARLGYFGPSTSGGFGLTNITGAYIEDAPSRYAAITRVYLTEREARGGEWVNVIWPLRQHLMSATGLTAPQLSRELTSMSVGLVLTHPAQYAMQVTRSAMGFWRATGRTDASLRSANAGLWEIVWVATKYATIALNAAFLSCFALFCIWRPRRRLRSQRVGVAWLVGSLLVLLSCLMQAMVENGDAARFGMPSGAVVGALVATFVGLRWPQMDAAGSPATQESP